MFKLIEPNPDHMTLFAKAEMEFKDIASKYGFFIKLDYNPMNGTIYFFPEVPHDWKPPHIDNYEI